jgi:hypothetical protein
VHLGNGDGTFNARTDYETGTPGSNLVSVALGDVSGDGLPDLVVTNGSFNFVSLLPGHGDGTFGQRIDFGVGVFPTSVRMGDLDEDGHLDLVVTNSTSNTVSILRNTGDVGIPVTLESLVARPDAEGIRLTWRVSSDILLLGCVVERRGEDNATLVRLTPDPLPGGPDYSFFDRTAAPRSSYYYVISAVGRDGTRIPLGEISVTAGPTPRLEVNAWPNPCAGQLQLAFNLPRSGPVSVQIFDVAGRRIGSLPMGVRDAGSSITLVDLREILGERSGNRRVYLRVICPGQTITLPVTVTR